MTDHAHFMRHAIATASSNPRRPFAAVLVDHNARIIVAEGVNRSQENPIWHGEIDVINRYAAQRNRIPWSDLDLYSTAEPCPMCQAAILWSGIPRVIFGTSIHRLTEIGWRQINIPSSEVVHRTPFAECEVLGGVLQSECDRLFLNAFEIR